MEGIINVKDYKQLTHQGSDWTEGFRAAVAKAVEMGGGTVYVPPGTYVTRSIRLYSNMTLYLRRERSFPSVRTWKNMSWYTLNMKEAPNRPIWPVSLRTTPDMWQ